MQLQFTYTNNGINCFKYLINILTHCVAIWSLGVRTFCWYWGFFLLLSFCCCCFDCCLQVIEIFSIAFKSIARFLWAFCSVQCNSSQTPLRKVQQLSCTLLFLTFFPSCSFCSCSFFLSFMEIFFLLMVFFSFA